MQRRSRCELGVVLANRPNSDAIGLQRYPNGDSTREKAPSTTPSSQTAGDTRLQTSLSRGRLAAWAYPNAAPGRVEGGGEARLAHTADGINTSLIVADLRQARPSKIRKARLATRNVPQPSLPPGSNGQRSRARTEAELDPLLSPRTIDGLVEVQESASQRSLRFHSVLGGRSRVDGNEPRPLLLKQIRHQRHELLE